MTTNNIPEFTKFKLAELTSIKTKEGLILFQLLEKERAGEPLCEISLEEIKMKEVIMGGESHAKEDLFKTIVKPAIADINKHTTIKCNAKKIKTENGDKIVFSCKKKFSLRTYLLEKFFAKRAR